MPRHCAWAARIGRGCVVLSFAAAWAGCSDEQVASVGCPGGTQAEDGLCIKACTLDTDCLFNELCVENLCRVPDEGVVRIRRFVVEPRQIEPGQPVRIGFGVVNASSVEILALGPNNEVRTIVSSEDRFAGIEIDQGIFEDTTIILSASDEGGDVASDTRTVRVVDNGDLSIDFFDADPPVVEPGRLTTLRWRVVNGVRTVRITEDGTGRVVLARGPLEGEHATPVAGPTTYVLTVEGEQGQTAFATVDVGVTSESPVIEGIELVPGAINAGDGALLAWRTRNASRIEIRVGGPGGLLVYASEDPGFVTEGRFVLIPSILLAQRFGLVALSDGGTDTDARSIVVRAPPPVARINSFMVDPSIIPDPVTGNDVKFSWSNAPDDADVSLFFRGQDTEVPSNDDLPAPAVPGPVQTAVLTADAPGGRAQAFARVWTPRLEREPNDFEAQAQPANGFAIAGQLGETGDASDDDWYRLEVPIGGSASIEILDPLGCPLGVRLELWRDSPRRQVATASSNLLGQCPSILEPDLDGVTYLVLVAGRQVDFPYLLGAVGDGPRCGDGRLGGDEECDDGNLRRFDGCDVSCRIEPAYDYSTLQFPIEDWPEVPDEAAPLTWLPYVEGQVRPASDEGFAVIPLPFPFRFYGRTYQGAVVHTNGFVSLQGDLTGPGINPQNPWGPTRPNALVAVMGTDGAWPDARAPRVWFENAVTIGNIVESVVWVDFGEMAVLDREVEEVRVGFTRSNRVLLAYGLFDASRVFFAGIEDHSGDHRVLLPGCNPEDGGCSGDTVASKTLTVFRNTAP